MGKETKVKAVTKEDYYLTISKKEMRNLKITLEYDGPVTAPIKEGQQIAKLVVTNKDKITKTLPLYASKNIQKVNFFKSFITSLNFLIWGDV